MEGEWNSRRSPVFTLHGACASSQPLASRVGYVFQRAHRIMGMAEPLFTTPLHCPPSGHSPGFVKCFLRVPQLLCCCPGKQGELSEICLQNLWNDLMAESVVQEVKTFLSVFNTRAYRTGVASLPTCDQIIPSIVVAARLSWSRAGTRLTPAWPWQPC